MQANLIIPWSSWWWLAGLFLVASGVILYWSYRTAPPGPWRRLCITLKAIGLVALAFCLLEPLWIGQRAEPGANSVVIVADNSQGLRIRDPGETLSRGEQLQRTLGNLSSGWQASLDGTFNLHRHRFDTRLQSSSDFADLDFTGHSSALMGALQSLKQRYENRPMAGIVLFTDGNATDFSGSYPDLDGLPPVYPVVVGNRTPLRDLSLHQANVRQTAFEDAPISIHAEVASTGFSGDPVGVRLVHADGRVLEERTLLPGQSGEVVPVDFELRPESAGVSFYQVQTRLRSEWTDDNPSTNTIEATLANNSRVLAIDRGPGPYRILYVAGRPNWEYKFLQRALHEDDQLHLVALIRVANREPKFDFRGRSGETSNPLFRGFGNQAPEEVVRYDQPVLTRLNTLDEHELANGFPRTEAELYRYHAVILDDVEAAFFGPDQAALLQRFVSERGGGLLMLGGMETFQEGRYLRTPIGEMLPIYLDSRTQTPALRPVRMKLSREGLLRSWARIRPTESEDQARRESMPPFRVFNQVSGVKPGASVIAHAIDEMDNELPALVVQRFGRGRTAALTIGDLWRWGMRNPESREDLNRTWRQLSRWLVTDTPEPMAVTVEPDPDDPSGAVQLSVRIRNPEFQPVDDAAVTVAIQTVPFESGMSSEADVSGMGSDVPSTASGETNQPPALQPLQLRAEPSATEPGLYLASYVPRLTAGYHVVATATNQSGARIGRAETGWATDLAAEEFRSLTPNVALLEEIARRTGGEVLAASQLERLAETLPQREVPIMESYSRPAWHHPGFFALAIACFATEWGLRRWKGLP
jgi:uncharacterized membrane protein